MAPKFKDPDDQIQCSSPAQLAAHVDLCQTLFLQPESEHTWERFAKALDKLAALTRGGAAKLESFPTAVGPANAGGLGDKIVQCVLSERAALSRPAVELVTAIAVHLERDFSERLQRIYIPPLLDLIRRTNNIVRERAEHALFTILRACPLPTLLVPLTSSAKDANPKLRRAVCAGTALAVDHWRAGGRADEVEGLIKALAEDRDEGVRKAARELWDKYKRTWPERVLAFIGPLSPSTKKRLDIKETDTYPLVSSALASSSSSSNGARSPSQPAHPTASATTAAAFGAVDPSSGESSPVSPAVVPVKKMGAKSFIAQRKAELARQAAAAKAAEAAASAPAATTEVEETGPRQAGPVASNLSAAAAANRNDNSPLASSSSTPRSPDAAAGGRSSSSSPAANSIAVVEPSVIARPSPSPPTVPLDHSELPLPVSLSSTPAKPSPSPSPSSCSPSSALSPRVTAVAASPSPNTAAVPEGTSTPVRPPRSTARRPSEGPTSPAASPSASTAFPEADSSSAASVTPFRPTRSSTASLAAGPSTPTVPTAGDGDDQRRSLATPLGHQHPAATSRSAALRNAAAFADSPVPSLQLGRRPLPDDGNDIARSSSSPKHRDLLDGHEQRELADWRRLRMSLRSAPSSTIVHPSRPTRSMLDDLLRSKESVRALLAYSDAHPVDRPSVRSEDRLQMADLDSTDDDDDDGRVSERATSAAAFAAWKEDGLFEALLETLLDAFGPDRSTRTEGEEVERGLVLLESLIENQRPLLEGHEGAVASALLDLRRRSGPAAPAFRQGTTHILALVLGPPLEPVVALYTLGTSLRTLVGPALQSSAGSSGLDEDAAPPVGYPPTRQPAAGVPSSANEAGASAFVFGLLALGRTLLRLPAEVVVEELPRLRDLLLLGLYSAVLAVRESAATAILAAQLVIRDETLVFGLLERLTAEKVNLLTYLFEKNKLRDSPQRATAVAAVDGSEPPSSRERLERELRRLSLQP